MTSEIVKYGLVVGGFDRPTIMPRSVIGDKLSMKFSSTSDWLSRITVCMKDGQFAGHINLPLADEIFDMKSIIIEMWGIAKQVSSRSNPGWEIEIHLIINVSQEDTLLISSATGFSSSLDQSDD